MGCLLGSISPGPLRCRQPGAKSSLLLQAAPGPARPSASPAPYPILRTGATPTGSARGTRSAAHPPAGGDASRGVLPSLSPTVGSGTPSCAHIPASQRGDMVMVALARELCPAARALHCQAGGVTKRVGWGHSEHQTQTDAFSPFLQHELLSQDRPRAVSASPCHHGTSQLHTPLLRLVLPDDGSWEDGDGHQPTVRDHLGSRSAPLRAAAQRYVLPARPLPPLPHCSVNK